ncbi:MAG: rhomboid family intramembrane serine protease [Actinomycetota bacterium]
MNSDGGTLGSGPSTGSSGRSSLLGRIASTGFGMLLLWLASMWAVEITDTFVLGDDLQRNGIHPRRIDGLDGILWAPFLHSTFGHLVSNSVPLLALGFLVAIRGLRHWLTATVMILVIGGGLTWLLAGGGNHIGASGIVFGYFGALMGAAFYERRPRVLAPALVALLLYSGIIVGLVPQDGISWEGHLFGLIGGVLAARTLAKGRRAPKRELNDGPEYPWELDEPWLGGNP